MSATSSSASTTRERLAAGETLVGTFLNLGSPLAAEVCARAGFDWLLVDLEHGAGTEAELIPTLQAIGGRCTALVRVEVNARPRFARALDAGADGVMVPHVDTAEEAAAAVRRMRYPPRGTRGVAHMNRAKGWGLGAEEGDALCLIQIETRGALEQAAAIAAADGIDVLFVGPSDLGAALETTKLPLDRVIDAARSHGKAAGILARSRQDGERYIEQGFRFVGIGSDSLFLAQGARSASGS
ncbi:MAG TPA: aldolase/citrate lyase family protein [Gaiellaceae bacterium]|nr:aldolase/citrate lyase family protein [Gaiellaceae bacterium]